MTRPLAFGRFDLQVRLVLLLLVVFLGIIAMMNVLLLGQARGMLEDASRARVEQAARALASGIARAIPGDDDAVVASISSSVLRRESVRHGFAHARVLDAAGRERAASGAGLGSESGGLLRLDRDQRAALASGRAVTIRVAGPNGGGGRGGVAVYLPLVSAEGRTAGIVEATAELPDLERLETRITTLRVVQIVGVMVIAAVAVLFANWVSRPYRRLAAVAGEAGITTGSDDAAREPDDLARAFRAVVSKLREQDDALGTLEREGGGLGDLIRFASRSASGMSTGVLVLDRRSRIAAFNRCAARLLELDEDRAREMALEDLAPSIPELRELVSGCLEHGRGASREVVRVRYPDGRRGHLGISLSPSPGPEGQIMGALVLMTDLTEIRELQEQARVRENLATVGEIAAGIAHEFRNALGTILANARLLEKRGDAAARGPAREILQEVETVGKTVDEFLLYARPPEPDPRDIDLERLIVRSAAAASDRIRVEIEGEFGTVHADDGLIRRVFDNLLQNAADAATEARRRLAVRVSGRPVAGGRVLQVEIEDDGPGIPRERLAKVFTPFFTTRAKGTGLGLALVQRTMVDLGGSVEAVVGNSGGALFRLRFPMEDESRPPRPARAGTSL